MIILIFILGLVLGSFINVLIYRLPRKGNIYLSRSACPYCEKKLAALDLIPVFSYLLLRGSCRYCQGRISPRYPLVELLTALGLSAIILALGLTWQGLALSLLFLFLLPAAIIDFQHFILPDEITLVGLGLGLVLALVGDHLGIGQALLGAGLGGGSLFLLALAYPSGMGGGDVKLMAMVGSFIGWQLALGAIFLGAILGIIYFIIAGKIVGSMDSNTPIPFGSMLAPASLIAFFWGYTIWEWYLNLFI